MKRRIPVTTTQPVHGGLNIGELRGLGLNPRDVLDFSASINPLGPPPAAIEAMKDVNLATYPDTDCLDLRDALASHLQLERNQILVGNGSTELIHIIARSFLDYEDSAYIFSPTFGEYEAACNAQEVKPRHIATNETRDFIWDMDYTLKTLRERKPHLVFLCNPNNPTGVYLDQDAVSEIANALGDEGLLVLDEAYISFVDNAWDSLPLLNLGNVALLRSMTKDYALTGLRLGYMLAYKDVIKHTRGYQYSWSVNALAQAAGIAALNHPEHLEKGKEAVQVAKDYLKQELGELGLECSSSSSNFLLVKAGDATGLRRKLLTQHSICVRDCTSFRLPEYIRIGIRTLEDCQKLVAALHEVLNDD